MIIQLEDNLSADRQKIICKKLSDSGYCTTVVSTNKQIYIIATGEALSANGGGAAINFESLDGVKNVHVVSDNYQLVSRKWKTESTNVNLGKDINDNPILIGENNFQVIAGPCSIEDQQQVTETVNHLCDNGVKIMRGGVFKPRTSPYSFRGGGIEALQLFSEIASAKGIKIISEVMEVSQIELMHPYVDIFQVGARNTQNFGLLSELGKVNKPVLLKRGISGTIEELLQSAEYVFSAGNEDIILCERGIRTFETTYRNTLDINAVAILKNKSHLPVVVDPSHGIGISRFVPQIALASIMAGADGLLIEVHPAPERAKSDGHQSLSFAESSKLIVDSQRVVVLRDSLASTP